MLYMIIDEKTDCCLIKIGKTYNWEKRKKQYLTSNPLIKEIAYIKSSINGTLNDTFVEKEFQLELALLGFKRIGKTEWFEISPEVSLFFSLYGFNALNTLKGLNRLSYSFKNNKPMPSPKIQLKDYI